MLDVALTLEAQDYKFANAFSFGEFLDANVDSIPVFNAGAFVGATDKKPDGFEFDPWGIGTRVRRAGTPAPSLDNQEELAAFDSAWATARGFLPELPKPERFDNSTWESTVVRLAVLLADALSPLVANLMMLVCVAWRC